MSTIKEVVPQEYDGKKIREYLKEGLALSSRLIKSASIDKRIFLNNKAVKMNAIIKADGALFNFASHILMASLNCYIQGISSTSCLVIITFGWNIVFLLFVIIL